MAKPQAFLQTLAERLGVCPAGDRDRQTAQLWGCSASVASRRRAPAKSISEQSGGELASADATTRAADAAVQIIQTSPGLSFCSRIYLRPLPSPPTSTDCLRLSPEPVRRFQDLAQGDVQPTRRMIGAPCLRSVGCRRLEVNVTMPAQDFLSPHAYIHGHFHPRRHLMTSNSYRAIRTEAFKIWQQETFVRHVA